MKDGLLVSCSVSRSRDVLCEMSGLVLACSVAVGVRDLVGARGPGGRP